TDRSHPDYDGLKKSLTLLEEIAFQIDNHLKNRESYSACNVRNFCSSSDLAYIIY
ncbi:MAG: hypothetical protein EZS28_044441, partial [Streblomastix strix]